MNKDMIICPKCGTRIAGTVKKCSVCGHIFDVVNDISLPNNNEEYSEYIREHSDKSSNKDAVGLVVSGLIAKVVLSIGIPFVVMWLFLGGLSGDNNKYWTVLIVGIVILAIAILVPFKFIYNMAARDSSSKEKKIFAIGMIIFIIAILLFYFLYIKR